MYFKKKLLSLIAFLTVFSAVNAFAIENSEEALGWPSQDPKVAELQKSFDSGLAIDEKSYHLGVLWDCNVLEAKKGVSNDTVVVSKGLIKFQDVGMPGYVGNAGSSKVSLFAIEKLGLSGAYREYQFGTRMNFMVFVRSSKENPDRLVAEWSIFGANLPGSERGSRYQSAVNSDYRVDKYLDCSPQL